MSLKISKKSSRWRQNVGSSQINSFNNLSVIVHYHMKCSIFNEYRLSCALSNYVWSLKLNLYHMAFSRDVMTSMLVYF